MSNYIKTIQIKLIKAKIINHKYNSCMNRYKYNRIKCIKYKQINNQNNVLEVIK